MGEPIIAYVPPCHHSAMLHGMKSMTVRQADDQAAELELVARVDGVSISQAIQRAIAAHIAARKADPDFQERLRQVVEADRDVVMRLSRIARGDRSTQT